MLPPKVCPAANRTLSPGLSFWLLTRLTVFQAVIIVSPVEDGFPTWDRGGVAWSQLGTRILVDGGRWTMIVDYRPARGTTGGAAFDALARACAELDIVCEGAWGPQSGDAGRSYLAVKTGTSDTAVMNHLRRADLPCALTQIHPTPPKPKPKPVKGATRARSAKLTKPPATTKPAKKPANKKR